jgi:hypothetical protein
MAQQKAGMGQGELQAAQGGGAVDHKPCCT